ncbi:phosphodiesterase 9 isoform X2 [Rhodnius prolixus]|uniref:phosphodiesterase 9 isoform X2 n=1 Tax=Rhodnius prolixus TaxID=13249 RepID=UPI003D187918
MGKIYLVTSEGKELDVELSKDSETLYKELKDAAGAPPEAALRLTDLEGKTPLHICPRIPLNQPDKRYLLSVYAPNGLLVDEVNMDLLTLQNRVLELEKQLAGQCCSLPAAVADLKNEVETFKNKLENTRYLSWLNCYKELPPTSRRLEYRRRSDAKQKIVREQFLQICEDTISEEIVECLRLSSFDSMEWSDEQLLSLLYLMFADLNLIELFQLDPPTLRNFLFQVYKNYNQVPFHNFRHSFCVAQMMYAMACNTELVRRIGHLEVLILLVSCICHDLDHPGYNNIYQINARTELALRYNDISPLENHHCSIAFRILELQECNIFKHMDFESFKIIREGIIRCILATDMARHNEILAQFKEALSQGFDYSDKTHVNLLCMVLIKVADISNEARPMEVAEPWLDRLLQEFFTQSDAEKEEGLPVTPFMDREKITKNSSQCSFIGFVLLPLFEALCDLLIELKPMLLEPVRSALEYYRRLNEAHHKNSVVSETVQSGGNTPTSPSGAAPSSPVRPVLKSQSSFSVRKTSIAFSQHPDEDDELDNPDDLSTDEEETVTEVAVSEKTLKFKISTESTSSDKKNFSGSRKGSRDRPIPDDETEDRLCDSCHRGRELQSRSQSLVEPDWRRSSQQQLPGKKSRSVSASTPSDSQSPKYTSRTKLESMTSTESTSKLLTVEHINTSSPPSSTPSTITHKSPGVLKRLRNLGERFSKSSGDASPARHRAPPSPASLRGENTDSQEELDVNSETGDGPVERKASTLPKATRKRFASEARKGWRGLLRKKEHPQQQQVKPSNGLSTESIVGGGETEESTVNNNRKKNKVPCTNVDGGSPHRQQKWMASLVQSFKTKKTPVQTSVSSSGGGGHHQHDSLQHLSTSPPSAHHNKS